MLYRYRLNECCSSTLQIPSIIRPMRLLFCLPLLLVALIDTAQCEDSWPPGDQAYIDKAEAFLNEIDTYRARFIQVTSDGSYSEGWLWLQRPRLLRVEYAPPVDLLLVADGTFLIFFDRDIDQVTEFSYQAGPFRFLLADEISFNEDMIVNSIKRQAGVLRIKLIDEKMSGAGSVTLVFEETPFHLVKWEVTDPASIVTHVTLYDHTFGLPLDKQLFRFTDFDRVRYDYRYGNYEE